MKTTPTPAEAKPSPAKSHTPKKDPTVSLIWRSTFDWTTLSASLILLSFAIFMIINSRCFQPLDSLTYDKISSLCYGSSLSIPSWLAIIGVEFAIFSTVILPRLQAVSTSKVLTRKLLSEGVTLPRLLNSQSTAPLNVQLRHGSRSIFLWRMAVSALVASVSVLYKYSFAPANIRTTIQLDSTFIDIDSEDFYGSLFSDSLLSPSGSTGNDSVVIGRNGADFIYGPTFNKSAASILIGSESVLQLCTPTLYTRTNCSIQILPLNISTSPATAASNLTMSEHPARFSHPDFGSAVELSLSSNGALQAHLGSIEPSTPVPSYYATVNTQLCQGYISWNKNKTTFSMNNPTDKVCVDDPFDFVSWNGSYAQAFAEGFVYLRLSTLVAIKRIQMKNIESGFQIMERDLQRRNTSATEEELSRSMLQGVVETVLLTANHTLAKDALVADARYSIVISNSEAPLDCKTWKGTSTQYSTSNPLLLAHGLIANRGSDITTTGIALQGLMIAVAICSICILTWPALPLIQEWSAQWVILLSGLDPDMLARSLQGTSLGEKPVRADATLFLHLKTNERENPQLRLRTTRPGVDEEKEIEKIAEHGPQLLGPDEARTSLPFPQPQNRFLDLKTQPLPDEREIDEI
ncbi:hypothetical protein DL98DRAFT_587231 [Cadophora sp. DSE1049]|nr:hypothetical protein DL98DRAFT_587231 [Cadophora sp. DSE1049]